MRDIAKVEKKDLQDLSSEGATVDFMKKHIKPFWV